MLIRLLAGLSRRWGQSCYKVSYRIIYRLFFIWLGVSIATHAFPSTGDASNIWSIIKEKGTGIGLKIIGIPIVLVIYLGTLLSVVWFDLFYGIAVAMVLQIY